MAKTVPSSCRFLGEASVALYEDGSAALSRERRSDGAGETVAHGGEALVVEHPLARASPETSCCMTVLALPLEQGMMTSVDVQSWESRSTKSYGETKPERVLVLWIVERKG